MVFVYFNSCRVFWSDPEGIPYGYSRSALVDGLLHHIREVLEVPSLQSTAANEV